MSVLYSTAAQTTHWVILIAQPTLLLTAATVPPPQVWCGEGAVDEGVGSEEG